MSSTVLYLLIPYIQFISFMHGKKMKKSIYKSFGIFFIIFVVSYFFLHEKMYYPIIDIHISIPNATTLYYDIGHGFHELYSVPIENGKATIHNRYQNIGLIKRLGIKKDDEYITIQNNVQNHPIITEGNFYTFDFHPDKIAAPLTTPPFLTIFWAFLFSTLITLLYYTYNNDNKNKFINYIHNQKSELLFFSSILLLYSTVGYISYPTLCYDTIVQQQAVGGRVSMVFSSLYSFITESAWLLTGEPIVGLLILQIFCMSLFMLFCYKIFIAFQLKTFGLLFTSILSISPAIYRFISMTEQRDLSAIFAVLSIILAIYTIAAKKKYLSGTYISAILFALGAVAMRYDFIGYFATVVLLPMLPWTTFTKFFKTMIICIIACIIAVCSSFCLEYIKDSAAQKHLITVHRRVPFYFGNFSYLIKNKILTNDEEQELSQYIDIEQCKELWDGYSISSYLVCSPKAQHWISGGDIFIPMAKKYFFQHPYLYIKSHFISIKKAAKMVIHWEKCFDDYTVLLEVLADKVDTTNPQYIPVLNAIHFQYLSSLKLSPLSYNNYRTLIVSYVNNKMIRLLCFGLLLSSSLFLFFQDSHKYRITPFRWNNFWELSCLMLGPIAKFFSISMLAPFIVSPYLTDIILFTFILFPTCFAWLLPLERTLNKKAKIVT